MRARSIKPGICDNEILGTADLVYTVLFERLWMMADREGRLEDRPLRIKAQAFPYREGLDVDPVLQWLHDRGFILRYLIDGNGFIQVLKFSEHQSPHIKEAPSKIPAPDKSGASTIPAPEIPAPAALTPSSLTPDSGLLTPDSKKSGSDTSSGGVGDASRKRSAEQRGSRLPQPFMLTAEMRTWAATEAPHVDLENATREFCDYWRSIPGQRGRKLDWVATWRNRIRECEGKQRARGNGKSRETIDEILARQRREIGETGEPTL